MTKSQFPSHEQIVALHIKLRDMELDRWLHEDLFSPLWWFLLAFTILYYAVWWKTVRKEHLAAVLLLGSLVTVMSIILDTLGLELFWWTYPHKLFPLMPPFLVFDMTHLPITFMWVYQWTKTWKQYLIALAAVCAVLSFVIEPLLVWIGLYKLIHWSYLYSYPTYILVAVFARASVQGIHHKQNKTRQS